MADSKKLWQELYEAAALETNREEMQTRVEAAKAAIDARLHDLQFADDDMLAPAQNIKQDTSEATKPL